MAARNNSSCCCYWSSYFPPLVFLPLLLVTAAVIHPYYAKNERKNYTPTKIRRLGIGRNGRQKNANINQALCVDPKLLNNLDLRRRFEDLRVAYCVNNPYHRSSLPQGYSDRCTKRQASLVPIVVTQHLELHRRARWDVHLLASQRLSVLGCGIGMSLCS